MCINKELFSCLVPSTRKNGSTHDEDDCLSLERASERASDCLLKMRDERRVLPFFIYILGEALPFYRRKDHFAKRELELQKDFYLNVDAPNGVKVFITRYKSQSRNNAHQTSLERHHGMMMTTTTTTMRLARRRRRDIAALVEGRGWGGPKGGGKEDIEAKTGSARYSRKAFFRANTARRDQQSDDVNNEVKVRESKEDVDKSLAVVLSRARTFTREDVRTFAELTGDANPIHFNSDGEMGNDDASKHHQKAIVHGALLVSMFPALVGSAFPGSKYLSQTAKFRRECDVGATVKATVRKMRETRGGTIAEFETIVRCAEDEEKVYVDGVALAKIR